MRKGEEFVQREVRSRARANPLAGRRRVLLIAFATAPGLVMRWRSKKAINRLRNFFEEPSFIFEQGSASRESGRKDHAILDFVLWPLALIWTYVDVPAGPVPSPRWGSPPGEMEVSTGISTNCLLSAVSGGRFFLATGFVALMPARRTLDFAFFGVACFAAILRAGLALGLPRFEPFLRAATRFFALAMAISLKAYGRHGHFERKPCCPISKRFATRQS
jgi:hypothetical protein